MLTKLPTGDWVDPQLVSSIQVDQGCQDETGKICQQLMVSVNVCTPSGEFYLAYFPKNSIEATGMADSLGEAINEACLASHDRERLGLDD